MDSKEKHIRENEAHKHDDVTSDMVADSLRANGKNRKRESTRRINRLWLWLGVLVLVIILLYWLFVVCGWWDLTGGANG